jgi:hypothetical protein
MESYTNQLFQIVYSEIKDLFQACFGKRITAIQYELSKNMVGKPGICGEYAIPTLTFSFESSPEETMTLFVRRQLDSKESKQSHHYQYLSQADIPVPKLFGTKYDSKGCEIIILDYATEIIDELEFFSLEKNIRDFIDLSARFSCLNPSLDYLSLIGRDMASKGDTRDWKTWMPWSIYILDKIWDLSSKDQLNRELKGLCGSNKLKIELQTIAKALIGKINGLKTGIVHSDFRPNNMVFLQQNQQLGLIDFEDVMIDAKYYDIAQYLGAPEPAFTWDPRLKDDYVDYFIGKSCYYGGEELAHDAFKSELFSIWYTRKINLWEWLPHEFGGPSYNFFPAGKNKDERCDNLFSLLKTLIDYRDKIAQTISA